MIPHHRTAVLLAALGSLCLAGRSPGQGLDPGADKPYRLRVVLGIAEHRLLTPIFQEQVQRELGDSLQAALGDLATVEVTRKHPHLKEAMRDGLQQSLEGWRDLEDTKTAFVLINYANGEYEIMTRQHDGLTNQATGIVRRERIPDPDRQLVARTAALLVGQDFGPVGTVTNKRDAQTVDVTLKGAALGVPLDRWIKKDDVLALVQISQGSGGPRATRVPWAVLRVQQGPDNGVCTCQLFNRHPNPLQQGPSILGYRCVKLTTTRAPLRLRLVQANARTSTPVPNQQIHVRRQGFTGEDLTRVQGTTDGDGFFSTDKEGDKGVYDGLAFVSVVNGNNLMAKIPVPIFDDRTVVIPVNISADTTVQLTLRKELWVGQVYESLLAVATLFKDLEGLLKDKKREDALNRAQSGLKGLQEDLTRFAQQRDELYTDAKSSGARLDLGEGDERLKELKVGQTKLQDLLARLEKVVNEENDPKRKELQAKVSQAQVFEGEADFGKALDLYEQVLSSGMLDDTELRKHYEKLKQAWEIKSDKHRQARDFIYEVFPGIDPLKLTEHLNEARGAFETCKAVGDTLSPLKLLNVALEDAGKLKEKLNSLQPDVNEDDRTVAKHIAEVADGLNKLVKDVKAYLDAAAPPEK
jgi:hypothetical protein